MHVRFSKLIVLAIIMLNIVFTAVILYMVWHGRQEPAVLVGAWFAFTTGELWALSKIEQSKNKEVEEKWKKENTGY